MKNILNVICSYYLHDVYDIKIIRYNIRYVHVFESYILILCYILNKQSLVKIQIYPLCRLCDIRVLLFILNVNYFKDIVEYLYDKNCSFFIYEKI